MSETGSKRLSEPPPSAESMASFARAQVHPQYNPTFPSTGQLPAGVPPGFQFTQQTQPPPQIEQLLKFWHNQLEEIQSLGPEDWKLHQLPLARIKKIMRSDEDVKMISAEAPVLFSKACEMFILELTLRAWFQSESNRRRTLQRSDIAAAITSTDVFDFLVDIVPREAGGEELETGRLAVPHNLAGIHHPCFPTGAAYGQMGGPDGGEAISMSATQGLPMALDPETQCLYQWQWAQEQAVQPGTSPILPVTSSQEHHKQ